MIRVEASSDAIEKKLGGIELLMKDGAFDAPVEIAAWKTQRLLVEATPKGWTGLTRREWKVEKVSSASRLVFNRSKAMLFLEGGTGLSTGGYIYPKTKRFLFIPLTSTAALGGWKQGMKFGKDYRLARRVKGIRAMRIVEGMRPKAAALLKDEMKKFLEKAIK